ncbi:MAG: acetoin dehydrogenase [Terriglobia bacterium]|nr:MAG: acetoin dehydrogenase [Terriglobia bacterium]
MKFPLRNGVAVITGAAGGIGGALADALAGRGCGLALIDINREGLAEVAARARACSVNVSEHVYDLACASSAGELVGEVLNAHRRVTVLVNNAGVALGGSFDEVSEEEFRALFEVNFWPVVRLTKAFLPVLREQPAAQIVNISSVFGLIGPVGQCAYAASKFAVRGVSEVLRHELERDNSPVRLSVVHPGGVRTGILENARKAAAITEEHTEEEGARFEKLLRLAPEKAAVQIVRGLERRQKRILVGSDARQLDLIQRLWPASYWRFLRGKMKES